MRTILKTIHKCYTDLSDILPEKKMVERKWLGHFQAEKLSINLGPIKC